MNDFFRYPHIPHIAWLGHGLPRDDKLMSPDEVAMLLNSAVTIEEKLDGANLGISLGPDGSLRAQNRGAYLSQPFTGQFARLGAWLTEHQDRLLDAISESHILFGEWCTARHSIHYSDLPDWWLLFDVYDGKEKKFWSTVRRNDLANKLCVAAVPCLHRGHVSLQELTDFVADTRSRFGSGNVEGVVVRQEDVSWLQARAKLVHPDFTQAIGEHWRSRSLEWNRVAKVGAPQRLS